MQSVVTRFSAAEWTELTIQIPPLRDGAANIVFLAELFVLMFTPSNRRLRPIRISEEAKVALTQYAWPGKAQQLREVIEHAVSICGGEMIGIEHLPAEIAGASSAESSDSSDAGAAERPMTLREEIEALEKKRILEALKKYPTQRDAAAALDIPMSTFLSRLNAFGIPRVRGGGKSAQIY